MSFHSNLAVVHMLAVACTDFAHVCKLSANSNTNRIANLLKLLFARIL